MVSEERYQPYRKLASCRGMRDALQHSSETYSSTQLETFVPSCLSPTPCLVLFWNLPLPSSLLRGDVGVAAEECSATLKIVCGFEVWI